MARTRKDSRDFRTKGSDKGANRNQRWASPRRQTVNQQLSQLRNGRLADFGNLDPDSFSFQDEGARLR